MENLMTFLLVSLDYERLLETETIGDYRDYCRDYRDDYILEARDYRDYTLL